MKQLIFLILSFLIFINAGAENQAVIRDANFSLFTQNNSAPTASYDNGSCVLVDRLVNPNAHGFLASRTLTIKCSSEKGKLCYENCFNSNYTSFTHIENPGVKEIGLDIRDVILLQKSYNGEVTSVQTFI